MTRTLLSIRGLTPRALAALAVTAAVAGCGGSGSAAPPTTTTPAAPAVATPAPGVASSGAAAAVDAQLANSPSGNAAGSVVRQNGSRITSGASQSLGRVSATISHASGSQVTSGSGQSRITVATIGSGHKSSSSAGTKRTATPSKPVTPQPAPSKPATKPSAPREPVTTTPASRPVTTTIVRPSPPTKTIVRTVIRTRTRTNTKIRTVVRLRTVVKVHTVTKTLRPNVPSTAFLPSTHPVLAQTEFLITGSNVGCQLGPNAARCSVLQRVWAAPVQPATCKTTWGNTISMQGGQAATFVCGGTDAIVPDAKVIPNGWDDQLGNITCQIRSIGVDCFSKQHHGFVISRTGYAAY